MSDFPTMPTDISFEVSRLHAERNVLEAELKGYRRSYENVLAERDALAAHVERLRESRSKTLEQDCHGIIDEWLERSSQSSLARRDLIKQAEALEEFSSWAGNSVARDRALMRASNLRLRAEGGE